MSHIKVAEEKKDEKALEYIDAAKSIIEKGNEGNYHALLLNINKAIAFAKSTEVLGKAYYLRAYIYFELEYYKESLLNTKWALENGSGDKMMEKECKRLKRLQKATEDASTFFVLSYPANKKIPWIVDRLELRNTTKDEIYATKDMKAGDIISIEKAVIGTMEGEDARYMHCFNCVKSNYFNLTPCDTTASMMFCSNTCKEELYAKAENLKTVVNDDMRILSEVAASFGGVKMLEKFMDVEIPTKTIFDYDFSNPKGPKYRENIMTCLMSLGVRDYPCCCLNDRVQSCSKVVKHLMQIQKSNCKRGVYCFGYDIAVFCISLFASLLKYSNEPNADILMLDNKVVTYLTRPVKKGEQILLTHMEFNDTHLMMDLRHSMRMVNFIGTGTKELIEYLNNARKEAKNWDSHSPEKFALFVLASHCVVPKEKH